jgi:hypothetical protein
MPNARYRMRLTGQSVMAMLKPTKEHEPMQSLQRRNMGNCGKKRLLKEMRTLDLEKRKSFGLPLQHLYNFQQHYEDHE